MITLPVIYVHMNDSPNNPDIPYIYRSKDQYMSLLKIQAEQRYSNLDNPDNPIISHANPNPTLIIITLITLPNKL